jgi:hypothetical protein
MPNLQHEPKRYVMTHIYICVFKRQFFNCCHMGDFCCSNQLFNIGQYRKEECFRGLMEVLPDCFAESGENHFMCDKTKMSDRPQTEFLSCYEDIIQNKIFR